MSGWGLRIGLGAMMVLLSGLAAQSAELVMFRRAGCTWCAEWDRTVGPAYPKSDIGKVAPIRMHDLDREVPALVLARPVRYTPTFILVEDGKEVGRIEGYPGEDFFWGLAEKLVKNLPGGNEWTTKPAQTM